MGHKAELLKMRIVAAARFKEMPILRIKVKSRVECEAQAKADSEERKIEMRNEARRLLKLRVEEWIKDEGGIYGLSSDDDFA